MGLCDFYDGRCPPDSKGCKKFKRLKSKDLNRLARKKLKNELKSLNNVSLTEA